MTAMECYKYVKSLKQEERKDITIRDVDFSYLDMSQLDLNSIHFVNCNFTGCIMHRVNIDNCIFTKCMMESTSFGYTKATIVDFDECSLGYAEFIDIDIYGVLFKHCDCGGINFEFSTIYELQAEDSIFEDGEFSDSKVSFSSFKNTKMTGVILRASTIEATIFSHCDINCGYITNTSLKTCEFEWCSLIGIDIASSKLYDVAVNIDLSYATKFYDVTVSDTDISKFNIQHVECNV